MLPSTQRIASLGSFISIITDSSRSPPLPHWSLHWSSSSAAHWFPKKSSGSHESKAHWKNQETFASLAGTVPELRDAASDVYGINVNLGSAHRCEHARLVEAFKAATIQAQTQLRVDATAEAHGEAVVMQGADWMSLIHQFKAKYGQFLHDNTLLLQSYHEVFEHWLTYPVSKKKRANVP